VVVCGLKPAAATLPTDGWQQAQVVMAAPGSELIRSGHG